MVIKKFIVFFFSLLALVVPLMLSGTASAEQVQEITINSDYDVTNFAPQTASDNGNVYVYYHSYTDGDKMLLTQPLTATTGRVAVVSLDLINSLITDYETNINPETTNGEYRLCVGWGKMTLKQDILMSVSYKRNCLNVAGNYYDGTFDGTFVRISKIGYCVAAPDKTSFFVMLLRHSNIDLITDTYIPTDTSDSSVAGGVTGLLATVGEALSWFWDKFSLYIAVVILMLCCGVIAWARGNSGGGG